jgi:hypothetical protein
LLRAQADGEDAVALGQAVAQALFGQGAAEFLGA